MEKFTKDTTLEEIFKDQKAKKVLEKYNLPCLHCPFAMLEMESLKIGDVCKFYNIDINKLLEELNKVNKKH